MVPRVFLVSLRGCVLSCLQLDNHSSQSLRECIVNIPSHPVPFFQDRRLLALLGELIQLKGEHRLVSKRLSQFYLLRPIRRPVSMPNADETVDVTTDQRWDSEKLFRSG